MMFSTITIVVLSLLAGLVIGALGLVLLIGWFLDWRLHP
jgi:hypothetical protein